MKIDITHKDFDAATPDSGMWLFNGDTFSDGVFVPKGADLTKWQEVTEDFKKGWEREHQPEL